MGIVKEVDMLKVAKYFKVERIVIGLLVLIVVVLFVSYAMFRQQNYLLGQELNAAHEFIQDMLLLHEALEAEIQGKIYQNDSEELLAGESIDPIH